MVELVRNTFVALKSTISFPQILWKEEFETSRVGLLIKTTLITIHLLEGWVMQEKSKRKWNSWNAFWLQK